MGRLVLILGLILLGFLIFKIVSRFVEGKTNTTKVSRRVREKYNILMEYFLEANEDTKVTNIKNGIKITYYALGNTTTVTIVQQGTSVQIKWQYLFNGNKKLQSNWTFHQTRDQNDIVKIISTDINNNFRAKEH